jgi:glycosyltransferase 2 family protein
VKLSAIAPSIKAPLMIFAKIALTLCLFFWLYIKADAPAIARVLKQLNAGTVGLALTMHFTAFILAGYRWWVLLQFAGAHTPFRKVLPSYYLGIFLNNFFPSSMGGDIARIIHLNLRGFPMKNLILSTLIDRVIGLSTVLVLATASTFLVAGTLHDSITGKLFLLLSVCAAGLIVFLTFPRSRWHIANWRHRFREHKWWVVLLDAINLARNYCARPKLIFSTFALSVMAQTLVIGIYYLLGRDLGVPLSFGQYFVVIAAVFIAASLPISVGGHGVREATLVALLVQAGTDSQTAIVLALSYFAVVAMSSTPGVFMLFVGRRQGRHV